MRIEVLAAKKHFDSRLALVRNAMKIQADDILAKLKSWGCFCITRLRGVSLVPKVFVVFAERFEHGAWRYWEHECDKEDITALEDSATAYACNRTFSSEPLYIDYLRGAEYLFNVACGRSGPAEGDTRVFGIRVDKILIAECETFIRYLELKKIA